MKRDMELIRLLLLQAEGTEDPKLSSYDVEARKYHAALAIEHGLLAGQCMPSNNGGYHGVAITGMTWEGHDFLDAARSETVWNKAMEKVKSMGGSVSIGVMQKLLIKISAQQLGLD